MSKNHYQSNDINYVCDGYGCDSRAISKLQVKVGETRTIFLSLCENCRTKFNDRNAVQRGVDLTEYYDWLENKPIKRKNTSLKIKKSLLSAQLRGHGQIGVIEDTPVGADAIRQ
ncbi:MAG: hypothetical protein WA364_30115 [Candidatus Nitrosopolaris sp.]